METREQREESAVFKATGFVFPFLLAGTHIAILQTLFNSGGNRFSVLLTTFVLFWPLFIVTGALNIKKMAPSKWRTTARYAVLSSVMAGVVFYIFAPAIITLP